MNRHLTKEDIEMKNKLLKRCSVSYVTGTMQIKKTRYHYTNYNGSNPQHRRQMQMRMCSNKTLICGWWEWQLS